MVKGGLAIGLKQLLRLLDEGAPPCEGTLAGNDAGWVALGEYGVMLLGRFNPIIGMIFVSMTKQVNLLFALKTNN